jgi:tetratricopeptide (TPR) repeat protein
MNEAAQPANAPSPAADARRMVEHALERQRAGDVPGAIAAYHDLLRRYPALPDAYNNLAILLKDANHLPAAIACLKRARHYAPNAAAVHSNLGNMLWAALAFDEAMAALDHAIALEPDRHESHHNLGLLQFSLGNYRAAVQSYDRALALRPDASIVAWDRALALLAAGDLAQGFAAYDVRFDVASTVGGFDPTLQSVRSIPLPLWNGEEIAGKTLYVYAEQGFGDTVQFCRFLPPVARRGARIVFDCQPELLRLLTGLAGVAELRAQGAAFPPADFHLPLLSLPLRLGVTLGTIPTHAPYLRPPSPTPETQISRPAGTQLAVGICWAGRPEHANDRNRSLAFEDLLAFCDLPGVTLYSLQKGPRARDIAAHGATALVHDLDPQITDFADTARLILQLDLVITADTAVAHLAGALGRPAIVLLPFTPDWRWLGGREDSPWYPSLRLVRQPAPRDWKTVIQRTRDLVTGMLGKQR